MTCPLDKHTHQHMRTYNTPSSASFRGVNAIPICLKKNLQINIYCPQSIPYSKIQISMLTSKKAQNACTAHNRLEVEISIILKMQLPPKRKYRSVIIQLCIKSIYFINILSINFCPKMNDCPICSFIQTAIEI